MGKNTTLIVGLLAVALLVSAMGTLTAVTKMTGLSVEGTTHAEVEIELTVTLPVSSINFPAMYINDQADTSDDNPLPFVVENDGSVNVDVALSSTPVFSTQAAASSYYNVSCRSAVGYERGVTCGLGSVTTPIQMPVNAGAIKIIGTLPFADTGDRNKVDIYIVVPIKEPVNDISATVTFTASQTS